MLGPEGMWARCGGMARAIPVDSSFLKQAAFFLLGQEPCYVERAR